MIKRQRITQRGLAALAIAILQLAHAWLPATPFRHEYCHRNCFLKASSNPDTTDTEDAVSSNPAVTGVTLKVAFDTNWGVAEADETVPSVRFTCGESLDMVHRLRRDSDAVLVGRGTVERDDCSLSVRRGVTPDTQPLRVILDPRLSLVLAEINDGVEYQVLTDGHPTVIYHCVSDVDMASLGLLESVTLVCLENDANNEEEPPEGNRPGRYLSTKAVLENLMQRFGVHHLMVEGGPKTALNFLQAGLVDRAIMVRAPISFEDPVPSGMTDETLKEAGLEVTGTHDSGVDTIDYWARSGEAWPTDPVHSWP